MALIKLDSSGMSRYINLSIQIADSYTRYWIGRLYETLYPPSFQLGNVANLDIAALSEVNGFDVPRTWSLDILYSQRHNLYDPKNLTVVCQIARLFFFLGKQRALPDFCRKFEIIDSLSRTECPSILRGVSFLK